MSGLSEVEKVQIDEILNTQADLKTELSMETVEVIELLLGAIDDYEYEKESLEEKVNELEEYIYDNVTDSHKDARDYYYSTRF